MSLTKIQVKGQPDKRQTIEAARRDIRQAAGIIGTDAPLGWEERETATRALYNALTTLARLEETSPQSFQQRAA